MTGHIPESFIEEIISRTDIYELVKERIQLKKSGSNYIAKCPFHIEKTPSFTVSQSKQFFHCFGCGMTGDALKFVMEFDGLHFVEGLETLAARLGITIPKDSQSLPIDHHKVLFDLLEDTAKFFQQQFRKKLSDPRTKKAIEYLKSRGITGSTAKTFGLGFAPPGWDNLSKHFGRSKQKDLLLAGVLVQKNEDQYYDRFRDRIIFPIRDRRGRVIGFGGRIIDSGSPKYLNSPETSIFNKGKELYGLYEARLKNRNLSSLIIVEGYIDVVCLSQFGIENVVATLGTALTDKHLDALFQQTSELYFCFDGDTAGKSAAKRALHLCLPHMSEGRRVKFVFLPNNEDPDSFVRQKGKKAFLELLSRALSLSDYLFETASINLDLNHIDGRAEVATKAKSLIAKLPKGFLQQMMYERLAELTGLKFNTLQKKKENPQKFSQRTHQLIASQNKNLPSLALRALAMLLDDRNLLSLIPIPFHFERTENHEMALLCETIEILLEEPEINIENLINKLTYDSAGLFKSIDLKSIAAFAPKDGIQVEFKGAIERIVKRTEEFELEKLLVKGRQNVLTAQEKIHLRHLLNQIEKNRG